jgi:hypothetical protein
MRNIIQGTEYNINKKMPIHPPPNQRFGRGLLGKKLKISSQARYLCWKWA